MTANMYSTVFENFTFKNLFHLWMYMYTVVQCLFGLLNLLVNFFSFSKVDFLPSFLPNISGSSRDSKPVWSQTSFPGSQYSSHPLLGGEMKDPGNEVAWLLHVHCISLCLKCILISIKE